MRICKLVKSRAELFSFILCEMFIRFLGVRPLGLGFLEFVNIVAYFLSRQKFAGVEFFSVTYFFSIVTLF